MSHEKTQAKLIYMANQIATFFSSQPQSGAAMGVATHINRYWEQRMRRHLFEIIDAGGSELHPLVLEAAAKIQRPDAAKQPVAPQDTPYAD